MSSPRNISTTAALLEISERKVPDEQLVGTSMVSFSRNGRSGIPIMRGRQENLLDVSRSALFGAQDSFPIGALCHVFDEDFFSDYSLDDSDAVFARDPEFARICAYLSIGELFTYLNEDRQSTPTPVTATYSRTLAFALGRSTLLWGQKRSRGIFQRWITLRQHLRWAPAQILSPHEAERAVSPWLSNRSDIPWIREVSKLTSAGSKNFLGSIAALISGELGLALGEAPPSFDSRFEWLSVAASRLRAVERKENGRSALALGLLVAAAEPGELMHLNWLRAHLKHFPACCIHYAGWSAVLRDLSDREVEPLGGLPRLIARELQRPLDLTQAPLADSSLLDLIAANRPLDEIQLKASPRHFTVSLVPGVVVACNFSQADVKRTELGSSKSSDPVDADKYPVGQRHLFDSIDEQSFRKLIIDQIENINQKLLELETGRKKSTRKS